MHACPPSESNRRRSGAQRTPLAARAIQVDIEDAAGTQRIELASIAQGRRYSVGKGRDCDIVVDGVYASRRHCEIWLDNGAWCVTDTGSTNGIRVESTNGIIARLASVPQGRARPPAIGAGQAAWLVLSARIARRAGSVSALLHSPTDCRQSAARARTSAVATPVTPIAPPRRRDGRGRSRRAWRRAREASIPRQRFRFASAVRATRRSSSTGLTATSRATISTSWQVDEAGATVVVHGDNGVTRRRHRSRAGNGVPLATGRDAGSGQRDVRVGVRIDALARG